ncbi:hypothetical protein AB4Z09_09365 [Rhodococcus sp. TAF43]|uniref:hypothetical protein n=1 Tax=unclassified Rhodococcus (in: high G+C Gram-positive bacteria) TaxID=192944 RepID=UPI001581618C|nr:hypothetical protein [Rhodococcus sp. W8901]QKT11683.1 hypothetical protein HUN07_13920 [Rhodococcus sp. W8901]
MAGPVKKKSKDGIVSRIVFFVVVIDVLLGVIQYLTGGIKFGEDGWFSNYRDKVSGIVEDGSGQVADKIESVTDGVGGQIGDQVPDKYRPTETPETGGGR